MLHTNECLLKQEEIVVKRIAYFTKWPNACRACDVQGGKQWGGTYWEPPDWLECEACMNGCPRCASQDFTEDALETFYNNRAPCPHCGYQWGDKVDDLPIEEFEDFCCCVFGT